MKHDPHPDISGPDPEQLLRQLAFTGLPPDWRQSILAAAAPVTPAVRRPWHRRPLVLGLAAAWALIAGLRLTTPPATNAPADQFAAWVRLHPPVPGLNNPSGPWLAAALSENANSFPHPQP